LKKGERGRGGMRPGKRRVAVPAAPSSPLNRKEFKAAVLTVAANRGIMALTKTALAPGQVYLSISEL